MVPRSYMSAHEAYMMNEFGLGVPRLTAETARAIGRTPLRFLSALPVAKYVRREIDSKKYAGRQERLRGLDSLVAVPDLSYGEPEESRQHKIDSIVTTLKQLQVLKRGHVVGVQAIIYATSYEENHESLLSGASALSASIDSDRALEEGVAFNKTPLVVAGKGQEQISKATYAAVDEAAVDARHKTEERTKTKDPPSPSLVLVMHPKHIATAFKGVSAFEMLQDSVAVLGSVEQLSEENSWAAWVLMQPLVAYEQAESEFSASHALPISTEEQYELQATKIYAGVSS